MFWRCGGIFTLRSLPLSHSLSFFIRLFSESAVSGFEIPDAFSFCHLSPLLPLSWRVCFVQTRWGLTEIQGRHVHCLTERRHLLKAPKEPWEGTGAFPDTFGRALPLCFCVVCADSYLKLPEYCRATVLCVCCHGLY